MSQKVQAKRERRERAHLRSRKRVVGTPERPRLAVYRSLRYLYAQLVDDTQGVTWVSITVDPENDTLEVLREYADRFGADPEHWLFCRGDFGYVKRLADDVLKVGGVTYKSHNDYAVIVDKNGRVAGMFNGSSTSDSEKGVELLKQLLSEQPAEPSHTVAKSPSAEAA